MSNFSQPETPAGWEISAVIRLTEELMQQPVDQSVDDAPLGKPSLLFLVVTWIFAAVFIFEPLLRPVSAPAAYVRELLAGLLSL